MEVEVSGAAAPVFAHAIQCLGKVGKELFLEVNPEALILRALNDSKSAFASVRFEPEFFQLFRPPPGASVKCKLMVKACQGVLRSIRTVELIKLFFDSEGSSHFVVFQLLCKHGIIKTHSFVYEDCEIYQAVFDKTLAPNRLVARPTTLSRFISHVRGTDEITLEASHSSVTVSSYHQQATEDAARAVLHTNMTIEPQEFEEFHLEPSKPGKPVDVTFGLRECKAILSFCEAQGVGVEQLSLYFHEKGHPVMFTTEGISTAMYHASLVLATIQDEWEDSQGSGRPPTQHQPTVRTSVPSGSVPSQGGKRMRGTYSDVDRRPPSPGVDVGRPSPAAPTPTLPFPRTADDEVGAAAGAGGPVGTAGVATGAGAGAGVVPAGGRVRDAAPTAAGHGKRGRGEATDFRDLFGADDGDADADADADANANGDADGGGHDDAAHAPAVDLYRHALPPPRPRRYGDPAAAAAMGRSIPLGPSAATYRGLANQRYVHSASVATPASVTPADGHGRMPAPLRGPPALRRPHDGPQALVFTNSPQAGGTAAAPGALPDDSESVAVTPPNTPPLQYRPSVLHHHRH